MFTSSHDFALSREGAIHNTLPSHTMSKNTAPTRMRRNELGDMIGLDHVRLFERMISDR